MKSMVLIVLLSVRSPDIAPGLWVRRMFKFTNADNTSVFSISLMSVIR